MATTLLFTPPLQRPLASHPTYSLLRFSAAPALKFTKLWPRSRDSDDLGFYKAVFGEGLLGPPHVNFAREPWEALGSLRELWVVLGSSGQPWGALGEPSGDLREPWGSFGEP